MKISCPRRFIRYPNATLGDTYADFGITFTSDDPSEVTLECMTKSISGIGRRLVQDNNNMPVVPADLTTQPLDLTRDVECVVTDSKGSNDTCAFGAVITVRAAEPPAPHGAATFMC